MSTSLRGRLIMAILAGIGLLGVVPITYAHLRGISCPTLVGIPACYVVLSAYLLVLISTGLPIPWRNYLFVPAWLGIFLLAASATAVELQNPNTCPTSSLGFPACFISLAIAVLLGTVYLRSEER